MSLLKRVCLYYLCPGAVRPGHLLQVLSGNDVLLVNKLVVGGLNAIKRNERGISVGAPRTVTVDGDHGIAITISNMEIIPQRRGATVPAHQQIADVDLVPLRQREAGPVIPAVLLTLPAVAFPTVLFSTW